eukprot:4978216-Pleurochrysis_carterae.AAC.2
MIAAEVDALGGVNGAILTIRCIKFQRRHGEPFDRTRSSEPTRRHPKPPDGMPLQRQPDNSRSTSSTADATATEHRNVDGCTHATATQTAQHRASAARPQLCVPSPSPSLELGQVD